MSSQRQLWFHVRRLTSRGAVVALAVALVPVAALAAVSLSGGPAAPSPPGTGVAPVDGALAITGDACERPYSAASPWNTPIGSGPVYHPRSEQFVARIQGPLTSDPSQYSYPVYSVAAGTPLQTVRVSGVFSDVSDEMTLDIQRGGTVQMPIPEGAAAAAGSDAQIILADSSTGEEWGAWKLRSSGGGWEITNGYRYNIRWSGVPPSDSDGRPFGSRGAGVPYLAGLVRPCELARQRIDHALAFAYDAPAPSHVYPATKSDGGGADGLDVPEGTRLQLDPALTEEQIRAFGCAGPCLTIAAALQQYGMYVIDNSGRSKIMLEYETTAGWNGVVGAATVSPIPVSAFKVIERIDVQAAPPAPVEPSARAPQGKTACTIRGTPRADRLSGTSGDDVICGLAGNDRLLGGYGRDLLIGGRGNDVLSGGRGRDRLLGESGRDRLRGGPGHDVLAGGADHDVLHARDRGRDRVRGGPGSDRATVDRGLDILSSIREVSPR